MDDLKHVREAIWPPNKLPTDLRLLLFGLGLLWLLTLAPIIRETAVRTVVAVVFVLFGSGYALTSAVFPESNQTQNEKAIAPIERIVLSVGASIVLAPLIGFALNFTPWGISLLPILVGLTVVTLLFVLAAAVRREQVPRENRFDPQLRTSVRVLSVRPLTEDNWKETVLTIALIVGIVIFVGSGIQLLGAADSDSESSTTVYLLTENESGAVIAKDYPTNFTLGESRSVTIGIQNQEGQPMNYTVVITLQRVQTNRGTTVVNQEYELDRFTRQVENRDMIQISREITPQRLTGEHLRLQFLVYQGTAPNTLNPETAYRDAYLWVNVTDTERSQNRLLRSRWIRTNESQPQINS